MKKNLKVGLRGFSEKNTEKLEKIFHAIGHRERTYSIVSLADQSDVLLVDITDQAFFDSKEHANVMDAGIPVVTVGNSDAPTGATHHIKGMLLATRVIRVLDQVDVPVKNQRHFDVNNQATEQTCYPVSMDADEISSQSFAYTVLVVDDSALMRKAIAQELGKVSTPLGIDFAESGEQALAKASKRHYDFMFLDVMMPGIDGYETCGQIRKVDAYKKTPIIMLSAKTSPMDEVKGIMSGCTNYITKPIESDEFQNMVVRIMKWISNYKKQ